MNGVSYGANLGSANTNRIGSPTIWGKVPIPQIIAEPGFGIFMFDDFTNFPHITTPTITTEAAIGGLLGYKAFGSSGGTLLSSGAQYGEVVFTEATDNEGVSLATIGLPFKLIKGGDNFAFESRQKFNTITDSRQGVFIGLCATQTLSATVPIAAAGTLADNNFVGFHKLEGDGDQLDTVYKADGVTQVSLQTDVVSSANVASGSSALVADTYIKTGMYFDGASGVLTFYINGLPLGTTKTLPTAAGTDFPNDVTMGLVAAMLLANSTSATMTMDYWGAAQWPSNY